MRYSDYKVRYPEPYYAGIHLVKDWVEAVGSFPTPSNTGEETGLNLLQFLSRLRLKLKANELTAKQVRYFDKTFPNWRYTYQQYLWNSYYEAATKFIRTVGRIPSDADPKLKSWLGVTRRKYFAGKLTEEKKELFGKVPEFFKTLEDWWQDNFEQLKSGDVTGLEKWISGQRVAYNKGELSESRIQKLESLEGWSWTPRSDKLDSLVKELVEFGRPPFFNEPLYNSYQQICRKHRYGKLSKGYIEQLEALPSWEWHQPIEDVEFSSYKFSDFLERYTDEFLATVMLYKKMEVVSRTYSGIETGKNLYYWMQHQWKKFSEGKLSDEHKSLLDEHIPDWQMTPTEKKWNEKLEQLKEEGLDNASSVLMDWIRKQKTAYRKGSLSKDQMKSLQEIKGWSWEFHYSSWDTNFEEMVESGNFSGQWAGLQRFSYRKKTLSEKSIKKLESLEGWSWNPKSDRIWDSIKTLREFVTKNERLPVYGDRFKGQPMKSLLRKLKGIYEAGKMEQEQKKSFEEILRAES